MLENICALWIGSWYFGDLNLQQFSGKRMLNELKEQFNKDGMHYELSPMYHMILMERLLDCYLIVGSNFSNSTCSTQVYSMLQQIIGAGVGKLKWFSIGNSMPAFGDSVNKEYTGISHLLNEISNTGIKTIEPNSNESGYYKFKADNMTLFADFGNISPSYQPGHTHADTFSFVLYDKGKEIISDTGISSYSVGLVRTLERSTKMHNTVTILDSNSSDVWGAFRVGRRANVFDCKYTELSLSAWHDGFLPLGTKHSRSINVIEKGFFIEDIVKSSAIEIFSHLHFNPFVKLELGSDSILINDNILFTWTGIENWKMETYEFAIDYNRKVESKKWNAQVCQKSTLFFNYIN